MTLDRQQAQQRVDDIQAFGRELERLRGELGPGLDDHAFAPIARHHQALLANYRQHYDVDCDQQARGLSLGMRIASLLGALALAASVLFLFYQFWGYLQTPAQVALLIGAALASLGLTFWTAGRDNSGYFTKLAAMVAFACLVLNTVMLGQIFNITPSDNALLAWAAYGLLLAYACQARLLLAAALICLLAFIAARVGTWSGLYWLSFGEYPEHFFPAGLALFAVPQLLSQRRYPGFAPIYRVFGLLTLFLPMLVLSNWGEASYLPWDSDVVEGFYQVLGFVAGGLVIWLGARRDWADTVNTGVVFFVLFLYTKLFDWWWEIMPKYLFFLVLSLIAVLLLLVLKRLRQRLQGGVAA